MRNLAVLSMHTSPLAQPGTGDGGGMNVYVRELSSALARSGVTCDVYTRRWSRDLPDVVAVEPGFAVHHVTAGPPVAVPKEALQEHVEEFTESVIDRMTGPVRGVLGSSDAPADAIHANYWLSGLAGHAIKHRLGLPLVSTFHTLDRVKAEASPEEVESAELGRRARAESEIIGCSDALLASCPVEVDQLVELYGADRDRVEVVPLGVDHAFFSPGDRAYARRALGLAGEGPLLLFVGRIQPLKGADVALKAFELLVRTTPGAQLVVVGGPSGPRGDGELAALHATVEALGLTGRVRFVAPQRHELLSTFYRAADCCLVPSRSESFGLVALEAAACGTPVVAAAVGGLTTLVQHGRTGYLVEDADVAAYARFAGDICADRLLQAELGAGGAAMAAGYTWSIAAGRLRRLYADLTSRTLIQC
ncbi:MAG TPA: glycosyltransferase [Acidimicrobiales bacterium]|nr:glycosyltransferase [Acidimicrobiales bacterium]